MPRIALLNSLVLVGSPSAVQKNSTSMGSACLSPETGVLCGGARRAQRPTLALLSDLAAGRSPKRSTEAAGVVAADGTAPKKAKVDTKKPQQGKPEEGLAGDACVSDAIIMVGALQSAMMNDLMATVAANIQAAAENAIAAQVEAAATLSEPEGPAAAAVGSATADAADAAAAVAAVAADADVADANAADTADANAGTTWCC